jgi:hypothetical protein
MGWRAAALLVGLLLAVALVIVVPGHVTTTAPSAAAARLCAAHAPRPDRELLARCAQVRGRVVWVRHGVGETHLAMVGALHLLVVKLPPHAAAPSIGSFATFTGALVRSRAGLRELQAW